MTVRYYSSTASETTLVGSITNVSTSITVGSVVGLPPLTPFTLALDYESSTEELVECTAKAGTMLTITRGIDGTSATSHNAGARVRHVSSARDFSDSRSHENADTEIHGLGPGEEIVGTEKVQSLENKTLVMAEGSLNRIDIFSDGAPWVTTINGDIANAVDLTRWKRDTSEPHEVAKITNNGTVFIRNQNVAADSVNGTYRIRVTKDDGTTDIWSVLQSGQTVAWIAPSTAGFTGVSPSSGAAVPIVQGTDPTGLVRRSVIWSDGRADIVGTDPAFSQLDVFGAAAQVQPLQRWLDSASNTLASVSALGVGSFAIETTTSGLVAAAGWSTPVFTARRTSGIADVVVQVTRTGADITAGASGNIADTLIATIPAGWRPQGTTHIANYDKGGVADGSVSVGTDGLCTIKTLSPTAVITAGDNVTFSMAFVL